MKLSSSNNNAILGLLSVLLAFPTVTVATAIEKVVAGERGSRGVAFRRLADCAKDDFLVTEFVMTEGGQNTTKASYEGCYEVADTLDGENFYKIDGDLEAAGGAFYASDNNGGNTVTSWYFADVDADTTPQNATDSFLCFDLDLNPTSDTHPADVALWGLSFDDNATNVVRQCDIEITCGCSLVEDTPSPVAVEEDDDAVEATEEDAAFAIAVGGTHFVLVFSTIVLVVANLL